MTAAVSAGGIPLEELLLPVDEVLEQHHHDRTELIAILLDVQDSLGYLAPEVLRHVAACLQAPLTEIYGIATFYKTFRLIPPARHQFTVCLGTACHVRGAVQVLGELERQLGVGAGEVTPDQEYGLESVNCVGACALGPVVILDGDYKGQMTAMKVPVLMRRLQKKTGKKAEDEVEVAE
jgi:NADH-quinone oxidoreductase subunit E